MLSTHPWNKEMTLVSAGSLWSSHGVEIGRLSAPHPMKRGDLGFALRCQPFGQSDSALKQSSYRRTSHGTKQSRGESGDIPKAHRSNRTAFPR